MAERLGLLGHDRSEEVVFRRVDRTLFASCLSLLGSEHVNELESVICTRAPLNDTHEGTGVDSVEYMCSELVLAEFFDD